MKSKLKKCPFCGKYPQTVADDETEEKFGVKCFNCGCAIYPEKDTLDEAIEAWNRRAGERIKDLPFAQPELLTDKEQRIFLAAMGREEKVCKQVDEECRDCREPYEDSLVRVCHEIIRKVKTALWET